MQRNPYRSKVTLKITALSSLQRQAVYAAAYQSCCIGNAVVYIVEEVAWVQHFDNVAN